MEITKRAEAEIAWSYAIVSLELNVVNIGVSFVLYLIKIIENIVIFGFIRFE